MLMSLLQAFRDLHKHESSFAFIDKHWKKNAMENLYIGGHGAIRRIQITASFCILAFKRLYDKMYDDDAPP